MLIYKHLMARMFRFRYALLFALHVLVILSCNKKTKQNLTEAGRDCTMMKILEAFT